jgi:non-ribosomal peptide synthetase component F
VIYTARKLGVVLPGAALPGACVHELFEARARETPDAAAVLWNGRATTYAELDARAGALAGRLRALGVGPEARVGVCAERSPALVAALFGVLKAGGAYVPLDPAYPADRLAFMLEDAGARVVVTESALAGRVHAPGVRVVLLDGEPPDAEGETAAAPAARPDPENLAYVIYTSGSTGRPKGVEIAHANTAAFLAWMGRAFPLAREERVLGSTSVSFDVSVAEI